MSATPIEISVGGSRWASSWAQDLMTWEDFTESLSARMYNNASTETHAEYMALSKAEQDKRKDVGGFVGGSLRDGLRRRGCCTGRSLITLDMDGCAPGSTQQWVAAIKALGTAAVYSTRKHDPEHPRLRAIFPTDRVMQPEEYQPCARMVAQMLDPTMQVFDKTTFEAERLMYWPSRSSDSQWVCEATEDGDRISVDDTLWLYEDWHDVRQWPACSAETVKLPGGKQADPTAKQGVVGAFCRTYDVPAAIEKFLPGVYVDAGAGRLTYAAGSTTAGAVLYDKGNFIYSHHSTDPAGGKLLNAWDLVRIHLFGQLDADAAPGTPAASLPSWQQMRALAENDGPTAALLRQETVDHAMEGFEPLPEEDTDPDKWQEKLDRTQKGAIACTIQNAWLILEHDPVLKGRIWSDTFSERLRCKVFGIKKAGYIEEILKTVGLEHVGRKKTKHFSLGMKQRLGIGLALVGEPDLLVLDEPINGLDPQGIAEVRDTIQRLQKERNMTICISSHILEELSKIATDYGIIHNGSLLQELTREELMRRCSERMELTLADPKLAIPVLDAMGFTNYQVTDKEHIHIFERLNESAALNMELAKAGIPVKGISITSEELETYFLNLTGGASHA